LLSLYERFFPVSCLRKWSILAIVSHNDHLSCSRKQSKTRNNPPRDMAENGRK
jgi:hypothetical protein